MIDKSNICYSDKLSLFLSSATEFMNAANKGRISAQEGRACLVKLRDKIKGKGLVNKSAEDHILAWIEWCIDEIKGDLINA